jgi:hypothetical protein
MRTTPRWIRASDHAGHARSSPGHHLHRLPDPPLDIDKYFFIVENMTEPRRFRRAGRRWQNSNNWQDVDWDDIRSKRRVLD